MASWPGVRYPTRIQDAGRARAPTVRWGVTSLRFAAVSVSTQQQWICSSCGFIYDPEEGDPDGGIPAGTAFEDIPDDWFCPVCGARKRDFELHEG